MELRMKQLLLIAVLVLPFGAMTQHVKKKYLGAYSGTIPGYTLLVGNATVSVSPAKISVLLGEDFTLTQVIGNDQQSGSWSIASQDKTMYTIEVRFEQQQLLERFILDKKTKSLRREGFFPQPSVVLSKQD